MVLVAGMVVAIMIMTGVVVGRREFGFAHWSDVGIWGGFESFG
jgi:hypothetical protein